MNSIKSTILINNYNNGLYLDQCLFSCVNQSYKNLQIILYDDNSTDNSIEVIKKYEGKIEFFITNEKNRTNSASINQLNIFYEALKLIKGDLIFLLDGDDFFDKDKVKKICTFSENRHFDLIQDQPYLYRNKKTTIIKKNKKKIPYFNNSWPSFYPTSTMCFRKKSFKKILENMSFLKDKYDKVFFDFRSIVQVQLLKYVNVSFNEPLTYWRQNSNGDTASYSILKKKWWKRRMQCHLYKKSISEKYNIKYKINADYLLTKILNKIY